LTILPFFISLALPAPKTQDMGQATLGSEGRGPKSTEVGESYENRELESPSSLKVLPCANDESGVENVLRSEPSKSWYCTVDIFAEDFALSCLFGGLRFLNFGMSVDPRVLCKVKAPLQSKLATYIEANPPRISYLIRDKYLGSYL